VATQMNGQGGLNGVLPMGQQQGMYGMQGGFQVPLQQSQPQPMQPTGQQVINGNAGHSYGIDALPPPPQAQQQPPFMGQQGNFGLTPQWAQGQQMGPQGAPQGVMPGYPSQPQPNVQQFQPQPQPQPQYPVQPQQQPNVGAGGVPQLGLNTRLDGPGVPQALKGRTLGEALTIYSALEGQWAQRQGVQPTPAQQSLAQMQPQQAQPGAPQQQPASGGNAQVNPWTNPQEFFGNLFDQKLEQRLGPVIQHTQGQAVTQAYTIAKGGVVDFAVLEPDLMQMLAGADPQSLANPATWIGAADIVRGRQMREGRYQPPSPQQMGVQQVQIPGQQVGRPMHPGMMPAQAAGQGMPSYGFFTEGPTAPSVSQFGGGMVGQPSQQDYQTAEKFRMPIQDYMAWKVGVQQQQQPMMGGGR
jgi:hypothetical protein